MQIDTLWPLIPIVLVVTIIIASIYRYFRYRRKRKDLSRSGITGINNALDYIHNPVRVKTALEQPIEQETSGQRNDSATSIIEIIASPPRSILNNNDHISTDDSNSNVEPNLDNTPPYEHQFQDQFHHYHLPHEQQAPNPQQHDDQREEHEQNHDQDRSDRQHSPQNPHYESLLQSVPTTNRVLYYGKISVREPLAKILAERQSYGDYEDLEVYNERGSSCFYEEIAGSTTSSVTYDQIGNQSLQNYQADH